MVQLLVLCPVHGPMPSGMEVMNTSQSFMAGNIASCPQCGREGPLQDFHSNRPVPFARELVDAVRTSTDDDLTELRALLRRAQAGDREGAKDQARSGKLNPILRKVALKALEFGLLGLLATAIQILIERDYQESSSEHEAAVMREMRRQSAQNSLILDELARLGRLDAEGPPPPQSVPRPSPTPRASPADPPRRSGPLPPDDFKAWWNANRKA